MNIYKSAYIRRVNRQHTNKAIRLYFLSYRWFWFHTQFWLSPEERRPYTFIIRDLFYPHLWLSIPVTLIVTGLLLWAIIQIPVMGIIGILYGYLMGHLFFGEVWQEGQQEEPPYID